MTCAYCGKLFDAGENAQVSEVVTKHRVVEELDLQVHCPHCNGDHYTFIPIEHLTNDKPKP